MDYKMIGLATYDNQAITQAGYFISKVTTGCN